MKPLFVPGAEDLVHIGPLQLFAFEHGLVVGPLDDLVGKAHALPGQQVFFLAGRGRPVPQAQQAHHPGQGLTAALVLPDIDGGALLGHEPQPGPGVALLLDLAHGGPAALAIPLGGPLRTETHQQEDHVRRKPQLVVQSQQDGNVRGGKLLPQLFLHRAGEPGELRALQSPCHVRPGISRLPVRRRRRGRDRGRRGGGLPAGQGHQTLLCQNVQRAAELLPVPAQLGAELAVVSAAPVFQDGDIEERRVAVAAADQPQGRGAGESDALRLRQMQDIIADGGSPLSHVFLFILHEKMGFVKREFFRRACVSRHRPESKKFLTFSNQADMLRM